jgi:hypothetical protein
MKKKALLFALFLFIRFHASAYLNKNYAGVFLTAPFCYDFKGRDLYLGPDLNLTVYCLSLGVNHKFNLNATDKQIDKFNVFLGTGWGNHFQIQVGLCDLLCRRKHISARIRSDWRIGKMAIAAFVEQKRNGDELRWLAGIGIGYDLSNTLLPAIVKLVTR